LTQCYAAEACGRCARWREGTWWMARVYQRVAAGRGGMEDIDLLPDAGDNILFKAFCALADGAVSPVTSSIKHFRDEYEGHVTEKGCPFKTRAQREELAAVTPRGAGVEGSIPLSEVLT